MRFALSRFLLAASLSLCFATTAFAEEGEVPEHPIVRHYPGATIDSAEMREFDAVDVVTGYSAGSATVTVESLEGKVYKYVYYNDPQSSPLQVVRNYENALRDAGFQTIAVVRGDKVEVPNVGSGDVFGAFRLDRAGSPRIYVNVKGTTDTTYVWSELLIVEVQAMEQDYVAGAGELYDSLARSGRVTVEGIQFDTGKATLQPASERVLAEVRTLMEQHADMHLRIEGHTDNVGQPAANQALSESRAAAVKAWLVAAGIPGSRMETAGFGDTRPVAGNDGEAGRAQNRRVELVRLD
ncbi:OmpA family protein [bacterium BD-1]|nr:OmpA family protein [Ottowia caeni]